DADASLNCPALQANGLESVDRAGGGPHSHYDGQWNPRRIRNLIESTADERRERDAPPVAQNFSRETVERDLLVLRKRGGNDPGCLDKSKGPPKRARAARRRRRNSPNRRHRYGHDRKGNDNFDQRKSRAGAAARGKPPAGASASQARRDAGLRQGGNSQNHGDPRD